MLSPVLILPLLVGTTAYGPVSRAASRDVTTFFQLAQEDPWENVNLTSMTCEHRKNRTWITLQLTNSSLTAFPICLPEALETLDLSNNLLEEVNGTEIANLPQLRVLSLRHNHLWSVRWGSEVLSSLLMLDLSFNKLSSVPPCHGSALPNLKWLSLAGNPLIEIQPLAFSCYPQLQVLNLSATLLGQDNSRGIKESAFAISTDPSEAMNRPGNSINVLDLSGTFLEKIQPEWARDLPNLRSLHLTKMPRLRSLNSNFFKSLPGLRELHCQDSHSLGFVQTEMFDSAPHLSHLSLENCNLSSFNPWNINSSDGITISLYGNPLLCNCQLSWLLSKPEKVVLQKAWETFCTSQEDSGRPSTSFSLLELYDRCQSESNVTLPDSNTASPDHDAFNFTSGDATAVVTTDSALLTKDLTHTSSVIQGDVWSTAASNPTLTKDTYTSSLIHRNVMSTAASNPTEPMLTKANSSSHEEEAVSESTSNPPSLASITSFPVFLKELFAQSSDHSSTSQTGTEQLQRGLRTTDATFPQEGPFNQTTSDYSTGATAVSRTTNRHIHSFATHAMEGAPRTSPPQLNSIRSSARSEPAPTTPSPHYVDDYDYEEQPKETPVQLAHIACDYNPCRHLQKPCSELQSVSQCSCPGTSSEDEVPDPPRLREVIEITDSSAQIRWCAPYSVVHTYELILHAQDNEDRQFVMDNIYPTARQYTLYNLLPFTTYHICVTASNKAGSSQKTGQEIPGNSCTRFKTKPSYKYVFAALSAASGLFLITTIILSVCLCKAYKKPQSEQYGTHLVSYKNPAFDHPLKLQATN
ncbi:leucine-rich repeat neuronal protein 4 [Corvus kubaryi]|uniref:leucine-rich repeat neuronal protein 4 n=1 Tax=Corvus kubaryi TaxID=68294 RepID=UPI001C04AAAE|nr:leucine-rich repeat neuronal protein 4 [Corvus kubaryi]